MLRFAYIVCLVTPSYFITVDGKRWSLTSVQSGDLIPIDILSEFQSNKILDFRKSSQFLLKSSAIRGLKRVSISGAICLFPVQLISHAVASQSIVACRSVCDKIYSEPSYTRCQECRVTVLYSMTQKFVNC